MQSFGAGVVVGSAVVLAVVVLVVKVDVVGATVEVVDVIVDVGATVALVVVETSQSVEQQPQHTSSE